ncbi:MAG TPA: hypothetical protein VG675_15735 [Bryobacteraceae bacterium]|nr:hypothetical protein [Bryobacteraceae bacterium]
MDLNLDTLKREILGYLDSAGLAVFRSNPGSLEGLPMVLWDTEHYPDYQMFLEVAQKAAAAVIIFASREFEASDIDDLVEQLEDCDLTREEMRDYESRLRKLRAFEGVTCSLELAFDHNSRVYVYEVQPDWYDEFLNLEEEILSISPEGEPDDDALGGYFSKN